MPVTLKRSMRHQSGASKFEFAIVVILVSILVGVAANRIALIRGRYEAVAMAGVLGGLRSALGTALAVRIVKAPQTIESLDGCNPFLLLARRPKNYAGTVDVSDPAQLKRGRWYYDTASGDVIYRVRSEQWFKSALSGPARARFRVVLEYTDRDGDHHFTFGVDTLDGIDLESLDDYSWEQ